MPAGPERWLEVDVCGGSSLDYVEVLHNNQVIHRESVYSQVAPQGRFKVHIELGWGERAGPTPWDVDLRVEGGSIHAVEPRFRGYGPTDNPSDGEFAYSSWQQLDNNHVRLHTRTRQNFSLHTASTEGLALEIDGDARTHFHAVVDGQSIVLPLADLLTGARTFYLGGFVSPAICFHRAVPQAEYAHRFAFLHRHAATTRDWYTVRVRQRNDQWAWSSPIWVES